MNKKLARRIIVFVHSLIRRNKQSMKDLFDNYDNSNEQSIQPTLVQRYMLASSYADQLINGVDKFRARSSPEYEQIKRISAICNYSYISGELSVDLMEMYIQAVKELHELVYEEVYY